MSASISTTDDDAWAAAASSALFSSMAAASAAASASGSAVPSSTATTPPNPLLQYQPSYSHSLIVQVIVLSCVTTLHVVLLLHLIFTTRYHLPLAKTNYILLMSGCVSSFAAILWQILQVAYDARDNSRQWPFMFNYLEYVYPDADSDWSLAKKVIWLILNALVVFLCHAAHIHVLTLLYPSVLETRLLLALLLPLALISCALSFSALLSSSREQDIFDAGSAICNSTLTLLYTCALLFWGLYIARPRAWGKTDDSGSTAVFGGCAIGMAVLGSGLSFFGVWRGAEAFGGNEGWLSKVTWCVLLWQTWFAVWWWIGAGMYGSERPLDEEDDEQVASGDRQSSSNAIFGQEGSLKRFVDETIPGMRRRRRRRRNGRHRNDDTQSDGEGEGESIEMRRMGSSDNALPRIETISNSTTSTTVTSTVPTMLSQLMRRFRKAHTHALRQAQRNFKKEAEENLGLNEVIHGKRGKGWSVSGILKARQSEVSRDRAISSKRMGRREDVGTRDDRRIGAMRLDDGGEDIDRSRVQDGREDGWEDLAVDEETQTDAVPRSSSHDVAASSSARPIQSSVSPGRSGNGFGTSSASVHQLQDNHVTPVTSKRFQNWRRKDVTRYD